MRTLHYAALVPGALELFPHCCALCGRQEQIQGQRLGVDSRFRGRVLLQGSPTRKAFRWARRHGPRGRSRGCGLGQTSGSRRTPPDLWTSKHWTNFSQNPVCEARRLRLPPRPAAPTPGAQVVLPRPVSSRRNENSCTMRRTVVTFVWIVAIHMSS